MRSSTSESSVSIEPKPAPPGSDLRRESWAAYFEGIYRDAHGECERVPWADACANPALVSWLNAEAPGLIRPGASVTVVGCGLGDDVAELAGRGYDAIGFDCSACAIDWAKRRHPAIAERFQVADLMDLPAPLRRRADLVVEVNTIQSVAPALRAELSRAIASLARPRGIVLAICRAREGEAPLAADSAPPCPLTSRELCSLLGDEGLAPLREPDEFLDDEMPPVRRLRAAFRRG
jgi:hypothetical protein